MSFKHTFLSRRVPVVACAKFLMGLTDSFSSVRAQILLIDPLPSLVKVFSLILQEERQRNINFTIPTTPDTPLLNSLSLSSTPASPFDLNPASPPVTAAVAPPRRSRPFCTHCQTQGHIRDKCFKLHGFPPGYKPRNPRPTFSTHSAQTPAQTPAQANSVFPPTMNPTFITPNPNPNPNFTSPNPNFAPSSSAAITIPVCSFTFAHPRFCCFGLSFHSFRHG